MKEKKYFIFGLILITVVAITTIVVSNDNSKEKGNNDLIVNKFENEKIPSDDVQEDFELVVNTEESGVDYNTEYEDFDLYSDNFFAFKYPSKYSLTYNQDGDVRITSISVPEVNVEECQKVDDWQLRAFCLNPDHLMSPNISLKYLNTDPQEYIDTKYPFKGTEIKTYKFADSEWYFSSYAGEYGGTGAYALPLKQGLVLVTYKHLDASGGSPFESLKNEKYLLDKVQQKFLTQKILESLSVNAELQSNNMN